MYSNINMYEIWNSELSFGISNSRKDSLVIKLLITYKGCRVTLSPGIRFRVRWPASNA
jgi:hypothetical protein